MQWPARSPGEHDGDGVIEDTLTKHERIEINVHIQVAKDGQGGHCEPITTYSKSY